MSSPTRSLTSMPRRRPRAFLCALLLAPLAAVPACHSAGGDAGGPAGVAVTAAAEKPPRVFTLPPAMLAEARARLTADPASPALRQLLSEADEALAMKPASVMDKPLVAKSGDKHDYLSMGPYWWPNLSTRDGLPYIRRDGHPNPESRGGTDALAFSRTCKAVWTLSLAHYLTGREDYARQAARLVRTWFLDKATRMNPNLNYGQAVLGVADGRPTGIIDTVVLIDVTEGVSLLAGSSAWSGEDDRAFRAWLGAYLEWLLSGPYSAVERSQANNHGTWYDAQVAQFALFLGRDDLARATLDRAYRTRLGRQIADDGSQPQEMSRVASLPYSSFNLLGLVTLAQQAASQGNDWWSDTRLQNALHFLAPYADPSVPWIKGPPKTWGNRGVLRDILVRSQAHLTARELSTLRSVMGREPFAQERAALFLPPSGG